MDRRQYLQLLAGTIVAALTGTTVASEASRRYRVAAIQMEPKLGDTEANLAQADRLLDQAISSGANWIMLPETFTSAGAFHDSMIKAISPIDGPVAIFMRDKATRHGVAIGGSYLAAEAGKVHNSFLLYLPDGTRYRHDKDQPTYWEACYYEGGHDDGVLQTPLGDIGVALCWEMIRSRTARRLRGKVQMLLAGSTWWTLPDTADDDHPYRRANLEMLQQAPVHMARMLGVPVIHAAHAGSFSGFDSPDLPDIEYNSVYLGESMICDRDGTVLARRSLQQGAGVVLADIDMPDIAEPTEPIPDRFWLPEQMPEEWKSAWQRWLPRGEDYYQLVTLPYLKTGTIPEYTPPYMRD